MFVVTEEFIEQNATPRGSWTRNQLAILGVRWPPKHGWKDKSVGKFISDDDVQRFIEYGKRGRVNKKERKKQKQERYASKKAISKSQSVGNFFTSREWRMVRMQVLIRDGNKCACCGATPVDGVRLHVDHIKPRSLFPELALDLDNLQVLCEDCNLGKMAWDATDWRPNQADEF